MKQGRIRLSRTPRFALLGCYGERNLGDEALLAGSLQAIRQRWPKAGIHVFSDAPQETARDFSVDSSRNLGLLKARNFAAMLRNGELRDLIRVLRRSDCLILGGGELIRTDYGSWGILSIFDRVWLAQLLGKPVIWLGVGVGKLEEGRLLSMMRMALRRSHILVREAASRQRLSAAGVDHAVVIPDLAFLLSPEPAGVRLPDGPKVSFSLLATDTFQRRGLTWFKRSDFIRQTAALAESCIASGTTPVFVPFNRAAADDDRIIHREIVAQLKEPHRAILVEESLRPGQVRDLLAQMDVVVGMRLHACILGLASGRPVVALSYDSKVTKVMSSVGLEQQIVPLQEIERGASKIQETWQQQDALAKRVKQEVSRAQARFDKEFDLLFETLYEARI